MSVANFKHASQGMSSPWEEETGEGTRFTVQGRFHLLQPIAPAPARTEIKLPHGAVITGIGRMEGSGARLTFSQLERGLSQSGRVN